MDSWLSTYMRVYLHSYISIESIHFIVHICIHYRGVGR